MREAGHLVLMCFNHELKVDHECGIGLVIGKADEQFVISSNVRYKGIFMSSENKFSPSKIWNFTYFIKLFHGDKIKI